MQGGEDLGSNLERLWRDGAAVFAAVCMARPQSAGATPLQGELTAMDRAVVGRAQADQVVERMAAAFGAELEVVHVEKSSVPAAGNLAAALVAQQRQATKSRRNGLVSTCADVHVTSSSAFVGETYCAHVGAFASAHAVGRVIEVTRLPGDVGTRSVSVVRAESLAHCKC